MVIIYVVMVVIMVKLNSFLRTKLHKHYLAEMEKERGDLQA